MIDKRPRVIARCVDVADVIAAVNFGRDQGLLVRFPADHPGGTGCLRRPQDGAIDGPVSEGLLGQARPCSDFQLQRLRGGG
jgi:hypothetical protein